MLCRCVREGLCLFLHIDTLLKLVPLYKREQVKVSCSLLNACIFQVVKKLSSNEHIFFVCEEVCQFSLNVQQTV